MLNVFFSNTGLSWNNSAKMVRLNKTSVYVICSWSKRCELCMICLKETWYSSRQWRSLCHWWMVYLMSCLFSSLTLHVLSLAQIRLAGHTLMTCSNQTRSTPYTLLSSLFLVLLGDVMASMLDSWYQPAIPKVHCSEGPRCRYTPQV